MGSHIVLTLGRSGSNTLCDMLNQSPEVFNFGEVLGEWTLARRVGRRMPWLWRSDQKFVEQLLFSNSLHILASIAYSSIRASSGRWSEIKNPLKVKTYGIKEFSLNFQRYELTEQILNAPGVKVIGLFRRSVVDRMISTAMLRATGVVMTRHSNADGATQLRIDPSRIGGMLDTIERENRDLRKMVQRVPPPSRMTIDYEDLYREGDSSMDLMNKVFAFLEVEPIRPRMRMAKIIRAPVDKVIANFDECLEAVRGTRHEEHLRKAAENRRD